MEAHRFRAFRCGPLNFLRNLFLTHFGRHTMRSAISTIAVIGGCILPHLSFAASYSCVGKVDQVTVDPNGTVNASFSFQSAGMAWQDVCSINSAANNVSVAACKGILAVLLTARTSQQSVVLWFDNASGGQCSAAAWKPLRDVGWYWGPGIQQ